MAARGTAKRGRPSKYNPSFCMQAQKLCELGATDADLADFFQVTVRTIYRWEQQDENFCQALKIGKAPADERVKRSLYHKAVGYSFEAVKIFMPSGSKEPVYAPYTEHVPPDTVACIFWLKNRDKEHWRGNPKDGDDEEGGVLKVKIMNDPDADS